VIVALADSKFNNLNLTVAFSAEYDEVRKAWESSGLKTGHPDDNEFHYLELAGFRKGGKYYSVRARLSVSVKDSSSLSLEYTLGRVRNPKVRRANLDKIGLVLDSLKVPCTVDCFAVADLSLKSFKPIFALPFMRFNMPNEFFDEIRGIRLVKLREGVEEVSVALDMYEEGAVHVFARTRYGAPLSSNITSEALVRLERLRDSVVTAIQPNV
jgi:hypothetical protein